MTVLVVSLERTARLVTLIGTNRTRTKAPSGFCLVGKNASK